MMQVSQEIKDYVKRLFRQGIAAPEVVKRVEAEYGQSFKKTTLQYYKKKYKQRRKQYRQRKATYEASGGDLQKLLATLQLKAELYDRIARIVKVI